MDPWQLIESAPKSGYIIGAWRDGKWYACEVWWNDFEEQWNHTTGDHIVYPTHWVPLPESP